jgi:hypothetical protein
MNGEVFTVDIIMQVICIVGLGTAFAFKAHARRSARRAKPCDDHRLGRLGLPKSAKYKPKLTGWDAVMDSLRVIESQIAEQERRHAEISADLEKFK